MSELRKDPVSRRWVIYSPERVYRPNDYTNKEFKGDEKEELARCPFCEGREEFSGQEILAYEKIPGRTPNTPGWWIRVLENKYPALRAGELEKKGAGIYDKMNGVGRHEIIVETPEHHNCLSKLNYSEVEKV
jgi:UDPglucose--hexose-1-phosphate uridylyltransferase